jgi:predicted transcriptional regulator
MGTVRKRNELSEELARGLEPHLEEALRHPVRCQILRALLESDRTLSPVELWKAGKVSCAVPCASYHMRALERQGLVKHASSEPVRGALKHCFSPAVEGEASILTVLRKTERSDSRLLAATAV